MRVLIILIRSLGRTFYEANVGLFLALFYLAFVLMSSTEHVALATSISTSLPLTWLVIALWSLYWSKAYAFVVHSINQPSYKFIRQLSLLKKKQQFVYLFGVFFIIGAPIWSYAQFIGIFNLRYQTYGLLAMMLGYLLLVNSLLSIIIMQSVSGAIKEAKQSLWHKYMSKRLALPHNIWFIRHLFVKEPMLIFLSKLGSSIILLGTIYLFKTDTYDWRLIAVGTLFALVMNSMLIYHWYEFIQKNNWVFNMPIKSKQLVATTLTTTFFLFIPEIILLLIKLPLELSLIESAGVLLMQASLAYFILGSLFQKPLLKQDYGKRIFYVLVSMIFIIMYRIPLIIIGLLLMLVAIIIFSRFYRIMLKMK